ncbi:MAG TPA: anthranilate synthase component I family protein, partial [Symbiobacteriaceae bacterium]|nr:anthranilate synthase component I family protein [Symbiobacteriaceae bacterium]
MIQPRIVPLSLAVLDPAALLQALPPGPGRFLLESGPSGPTAVRRYSFVGAEPFLTLVSKGGQAQVTEGDHSWSWAGDPLDLLQELLERFRAAPLPDWPVPAGGAFGLLGYDLGRQIEALPSLAADELGMPDLYLGFFAVLLVIDHREGRAALVVAPPAEDEDEAEAKALRWADALTAVRAVAEAGPEGLVATDAHTLPPQAPTSPGPLTSCFARPAYEAAVQRAIDYIWAGDLFQVNLSQRLRAPWPHGGWALYQNLRTTAPAPFAAFLDGGAWQLASISPERFIEVADGRIETRPIKGTRPRGQSPAADEANAQELLAAEKDAAELLMIVDLQRNDLGRVCRWGSVRVPDLRRLEATPYVWHTVATVAGELRPDADARAILRAAFPGGSITGAPKVRAMQIIEELEPVRRGAYTGSIGYIGFDGRMDWSIAIRTVTVQ